jgi:hypothetical protein
VDRLFDEDRGVGEDVDPHALRERLVDLVDLVAHAFGDGDGIRASLLEDPHRLQGHAVEAGDVRRVLEAVFDERDVLEVDRRRLRLPDDDLPELIDVEGLAEEAGNR